MKSIIATGILLGLGSAAVAGPYVNIENNAGFTGSDFNAHVTDFHLGYEDGGDFASWYIQAGPSLFVEDGGESDTKATGKIGGSVAATDNISVYGELSAAFDDVNLYGTKVGVKYTF